MQVKWLSVVGGRDATACVGRVTDCLLSPNVQRIVNITGAKGERELRPLNEVIYGMHSNLHYSYGNL